MLKLFSQTAGSSARINIGNKNIAVSVKNGALISAIIPRSMALPTGHLVDNVVTWKSFVEFKSDKQEIYQVCRSFSSNLDFIFTQCFTMEDNVNVSIQLGQNIVQNNLSI